MALADVEQHRLDALLGHRLVVDVGQPERTPVQRHRRVEVLDGDAYVVDPVELRAGG